MPFDIQQFVELGRDRLPGLVGLEVDSVEVGAVRMHLPLRAELLAPNGYLHAATVVALADSACGYGCIASLPEGATGAPVAGYLYFPNPRTKNATFQLEFVLNGNNVTLNFH